MFSDGGASAATADILARRCSVMMILLLFLCGSARVVIFALLLL